jgi:hypothetical protein
MVHIQIRGGSFPPGAKCVFREDHFRFNEGIFTSGDETIYIGDAIAARVIEQLQEATSEPEGSAVLGGAGVGALAGVWFSPFSAGVSVVVGAVLGAAAASAAGMTETPGHITFEMRFTNDRSLIGTVENSGWADIQAAWRISDPAAPGGPITVKAPVLEKDVTSPAKSLPPADISPDENSKGVVQWLRGFTPWGGR